MACNSRHLSVDGDEEKLITLETRKRKCDKNDVALKLSVTLVYIRLYFYLLLKATYRLTVRHFRPSYSGIKKRSSIITGEMRSSGVLYLQLLLLIVPHISCWNDGKMSFIWTIQLIKKNPNQIRDLGEDRWVSLSEISSYWTYFIFALKFQL